MWFAARLPMSAISALHGSISACTYPCLVFKQKSFTTGSPSFLLPSNHRKSG
uniref:Uncharacterized protein n=1 Tax=Oryza brachyantha TaxID=4533 RepID=J3LK48_ORYBR